MYETNNENLKDTKSTHSCPTISGVFIDARRVAPNPPSKLGLNPMYTAEMLDTKAVVLRKRWCEVEKMASSFRLLLIYLICLESLASSTSFEVCKGARKLAMWRL